MNNGDVNVSETSQTEVLADSNSIIKEKETEICEKCGFELREEQEFCPKCGTPKAKKNTCGKCGAELSDGQEFCHKCGQKAGLTVDDNVLSAINQFNDNINGKKHKRKPIHIIITVICIVAILGLAAVKFVIPKIFIDMEGYLEKADYEKAYQKAKTESDKSEVIIENAVAVQSAVYAEKLKDPSSFYLRDAYYLETANDDDESMICLVLYVSGTNGFGANVSSYCLYIWDNDFCEWEYITSVSDLSDDEYSDYDDEVETLEKLLDNSARIFIKRAISDGVRLNKKGVKRINKMFKDDVLDEVELLDVEYDYFEE